MIPLRLRLKYTPVSAKKTTRRIHRSKMTPKTHQLNPKMRRLVLNEVEVSRTDNNFQFSLATNS